MNLVIDECLHRPVRFPGSYLAFALLSLRVGLKAFKEILW